MTILNPAKKVKRNKTASSARVSPPPRETRQKGRSPPVRVSYWARSGWDEKVFKEPDTPLNYPFRADLSTSCMGTGPRRLPGPVGRSKTPNPVLLAAHRTESGTGIKVAFYGREGRVWEKTQKRGRALERSRPLAGDDFYLAFFSSSSSFFRSADLFLRSWNLSRFLSASAL